MASVRDVEPILRRMAWGLLVAFWVLIALGAAANQGYAQDQQFVSSLASRGAQVPGWALAALGCVAAAHLLVAPQLRRHDRIVGTSVLVSGLALLAVAAFRVQCPGEAYCVRADPADAFDTVHVAAVLTYSAAMLTAMVRTGVKALAAPETRWVGVGSMGAAGLFVAALVLTQGPVPGVSQRLWAAVGQIWLVAAVEVAAASHRKAP